LDKTNACCSTLGVGRVDSHTFLVGLSALAKLVRSSLRG
jgi:hypothetical protein